MNLNDPFISTLVPLILLFGIFYFLLIRPQQQRVKVHQQIVEAVGRGDTAVTEGGNVGRGCKVKDNREISVEVPSDQNGRVRERSLGKVACKESEAESEG